MCRPRDGAEPGPATSRGPADRVDVDAGGARGEQRARASVGRRSGRQHVVDEHDRARGAQVRRAHGERAVQVPPALGGRQAGLRLTRPIVLVDDVLTTGATADACARALLAAGAGRVDVYTVGRAP